jgi:plastocyanin
MHTHSFASLVRFALCAAALPAFACGGGATSPPPPSADLAGTVQGCETDSFVDHTADTAVVAVTPWDLTSEQPRCVKVKVGQMVSWASSSTHPLIAHGGDSGNPIPATAQTTPQTVTFANAGTFGFWCNVHTTLMQGAVLVVE